MKWTNLIRIWSPELQEAIELKKCEKCGKEYELSKDDEGKRKQIVSLVKSRIVGALIRNVAPGLSEAIKSSENYCNTCFHEETDFYTQAIQGILKKKKEGD